MSIYKLFKFIEISIGAKKGKKYFVLLLCVISAFLHVEMNMALIPLIDNFMISETYWNWRYIVLFIGLMFLNSVFKCLRKMYINYLSIDSEKILTDLIAKKLGEKGIDFFEHTNEGELVLLLNGRIREYSSFLLRNLENFLYEPWVFLMTFLAVYHANNKIAVIVFFIIILSSYGNYIISDRIVRISEEVYNIENELQNYQKEITEDYDNIIMSGLNVHITEMHRRKARQMLDKYNHMTKAEQRAYIPALLNEYLPTIIFLLFSAIEVSDGNMTYGTFTALLSLVSGVSLPITYYLRSFNKLREQYPFVNNVSNLLLSDANMFEEILDLNNESNIVEMTNVDFFYNEKKKIIKNVNISIKRGEKVAIVGESGSGKTTILKLIMGFYKATSGSVKTFGMDAFHNQKAIWNRIGYIDNDNYLFSGTVKYNITLKNNNYTEEENIRYQEICNQLNISDIERAVDEIVQFGQNLSGGQRLRINLARALYRNAELLILDEPVAAFDKETEKLVIEILQKLDITMIVTTHRPNLLNICNKVMSSYVDNNSSEKN